MDRWSTALAVDRLIDAAIVAFLICAVVSITAAQTAILIAEVAWLVKLVRTSQRGTLRLPLLTPLAAFYLTSALASATASDPWLSFRALRDIFEPAFFFLLVNHVSGDMRATTLTQVLIGAATLTAVYGLLQSIVEGPAFRVHGTMSIYMTFAGIMMLSALMALAQLLFRTPSRWSWGWLGAVLLLTAALVMTQTRGAWMGLGVGGGLILACRHKYWLLVLPLAAAVIFLVAPDSVRARIRSISDPQDVTARERLYMWGSGVQIIRDHPWTGVGIHGVKAVYPSYKHPQAVRERRAHLHNNLFQIAAERGLLGLAAWLWIWVAFYRYAWMTFRARGSSAPWASALIIGSVASVTGFHVAGLFEFTFGDSEVIMVVYFLMALPYMVQGGPRKAPVHAAQV
jgi:putative inorganic carbon (HCO3(-)) transporter